jgi:hypothetical protein
MMTFLSEDRAMNIAYALGVVAIVTIYPWLIFWAIGTLFPLMQIPYDIWTVIAFYLLNTLFLRTYTFTKELDD